MDDENFCKLKELEPEEFKEKRFLAKSLNFGLLSGRGATALHKKLEKGGIFQSEKETYKQWQKAYKSILKYHKNREIAYWRSQFTTNAAASTNPVFAN